MSKFRILFIDEDQDYLDFLEDSVENLDTDNEFEVELSLPERDLVEMINKIFSINPDVIMTRYMLNDFKMDVKYNVPYNGLDICREVNVKNKELPVFISSGVRDILRYPECVISRYLKNK